MENFINFLDVLSWFVLVFSGILVLIRLYFMWYFNTDAGQLENLIARAIEGKEYVAISPTVPFLLFIVALSWIIAGG